MTNHRTSLAEDAYLEPHWPAIRERRRRAAETCRRLAGSPGALVDVAHGHNYFGIHRHDDGWTFREWAPNATAVSMYGDFSQWQIEDRYALQRLDRGIWEIHLPPDALQHGDTFRLHIRWPGGEGERIPAYARRVVKDPDNQSFNAQVWAPTAPYQWRHQPIDMRQRCPIIYEAHVGMAQEEPGIGSFEQFRENILPRIADAGYNTVQIMAVMEHPYYGSFGYHVSNFFAVCSRFGTPDDLKALVDAAHERDIAIIIDLVHSHAVRNEIEGLGRFDGTRYQYFHDGDRGEHTAWDSLCFDYGKDEVLHFLLSNCRYWLEEYRLDGFRFDGITSMLYFDHGLGTAYDCYDRYFDQGVDETAVTYLTLANALIHQLNPGAITVAEDVSGMPGLASPAAEGGIGFDYRLAMGVPDCWFKLLKEVSDENWCLDYIWGELNNRRPDERVVSYCECHDQAIVGGKSVIFQMADADMYFGMEADNDSKTEVSRAIALHKLIRLATFGTAGNGYLNFIGNEFGHPEWVDFPREGNNWSYHYARRQWSLRDDPKLKYHWLADFDKAMLALHHRRPIAGALPARRLYHHDDHKLIAFERHHFIFCFNFHPHRTEPEMRIPLQPGEYEIILSSDDACFGGYNNVTSGSRCITAHDELHLAIPPRAAVVLDRIA